MSRSYRHNVRFPYEQDKSAKKWAKRKVRRSKGIYNGNSSRKLYDSWLIRMGHWGYESEQDFIEQNLPYSDGDVEKLRRTYRRLRSK
jgi:uncharacterized lipoprotein YddW (UPF0748 family)